MKEARMPIGSALVIIGVLTGVCWLLFYTAFNGWRIVWRALIE